VNLLTYLTYWLEIAVIAGLLCGV